MPFRWGIVKDYNDKKFNIINIRDDSLLTKKTYKELAKSGRCIITASGFYEWSKGKTKTPYYITLKDSKMMCFAGLYDIESSECAIITTKANSLIGAIHDRMPVILAEDCIDKWLAEDLDASLIESFLIPYDSSMMEMHEVSRAVNNTRNDYSELILPVSGEGLF